MGLSDHPCFDRAVRIYRNALVDWQASEGIRRAAATLGMTRRAYCDSRLAANQFQWAAAATQEPFTRTHLEAAWLEATVEADRFVVAR